jgi:hypothetical protein
VGEGEGEERVGSVARGVKRLTWKAPVASMLALDLPVTVSVHTFACDRVERGEPRR